MHIDRNNTINCSEYKAPAAVLWVPAMVIAYVKVKLVKNVLDGKINKILLEYNL